MEGKKIYLDWIRVFAVFLVLYGHLANAASWTTQETSVFSLEYILPINDGTTHNAYIIDTFFAKYGTASAVIGVILFLWLTGYLTAMTREKYTGKEFFYKRIIRLYPALIISVVLCGLIAARMGVKYTLMQYVSNSMLLYSFMGYGATIGTLWTLLVELVFYCIVIHCKKLNFKNIVIIDLIILFFILVQAITHLGAHTFLYTLKFVPIILFGSMMYQFQNSKSSTRYFKLTLVAILTYVIPFIAINFTYTGEVNYKSPASYIFALLFWIAFSIIEKFSSKFIIRTNRVIKFIVDTSYLVYLLQLNVGFTTMYFLREAGIGPYINIICGVLVTFFVSAIIHYLYEKPVQKKLYQKMTIT